MGNLLEKEMEEIWQSPKKQRFIEMIKNESNGRICAAYKKNFKLI